MLIKAVIVAGGKGERFWPLSRKRCPKQCLTLFEGKTLIRNTVERILPLVDVGNIYISTGVHIHEQIMEMVPEIDNYIIEPVPRDTAAAIGFAAVKLMQDLDDAVMIILPADHYIKDTESFLHHIRTGLEFAKQGKLVTIGIKPTSASTGYGYIKPGEVLKGEGIRVFATDEFVEKPNAELAKTFVEKGYMWNSGMFMWKCSVILDEIKRALPGLHAGLRRIKGALGSDQEFAVIEQVFNDLEPISIDFGVMQSVKDDVVVEGSFDWDDVGSWLSIERHFPKDDNGNVVNTKKGKFAEVDSSNNIVCCNKQLIGLVGVKDMIVIQTDDATLICSKEKAQDVKKLVEKMSADSDLKQYLE
ncbi:mannose-1-phosphate guanylyltransferase [Candidatus Woesearchaeota archaeon]|nr:mannose-1-phosphate guanylyltransferase [Candidatus Woesearchaeota archaeon]